ncbi:UDP-glucuronosyltransferase 2A3-like [Saccoglossus kowalevskii]
MGKHKILLAVLYVLILGFHVVHCANILIYGMHAAGSHTQNIAYVGEALIRHGHSVDVLTVSSDKFIHLYTELGVPTLEPVIINYENEDILPHFFDNKLTYGEAFEKMVGTNAAQCDAVLQHKKHLRDTLKPYDIAVTDAVCHCCAMLLKYIGIPYVLLHTMKDVGYATDVTAPLSYYPIEETTMMLTNKMTFTDRLQNTLASLLLPSYKDINMAFLRLYHKHNITPGIYSFQQASLHLLVKDFTIDYVHPLIPNVVPIGLLTTRPANGLPSVSTTT